jgi:hypothetical protein
MENSILFAENWIVKKNNVDIEVFLEFLLVDSHDFGIKIVLGYIKKNSRLFVQKIMDELKN